MTAIQALKIELDKVQRAMSKCVNEYDIVMPCHKHKYNMLVDTARVLRESIKWMEDLYGDQHEKGMPSSLSQESRAENRAVAENVGASGGMLRQDS